MKTDEFILLLQIIKNNGNIENLKKYGYQYSQIAQIINYVLEQSYVLYSEKGLRLTHEGERILSTFNKQLHRKNSEAFISPQKEYLLNKRHSIFDIYLPKDSQKLD
jgi:hypothetical protein